MTSTTISVVVPCHNDGRYLPLLVSRLMTQSLPPSEIVVVDDASTNDSVQVIEALRARYPEVRLIRNEQNCGVIRSINRGVEAATGEYIYMTGCDDLPLPGLFQKSIALLSQHPRASACFSNPCTWESETWSVIERIPDLPDSAGYFSPSELAEGLGVLPFVHPHSGLVKRTSLEKRGGYDPVLGPSADWFFWMALVFREGACYIPEPLSLWHVRKNSYLATSFSDDSKRKKIAELIATRLLEPAQEDVYPFFESSNALSNYGSSAVGAIRDNPNLDTPKGRALLNWRHGRRSVSEDARHWAREVAWQLAADAQALLPPAPRSIQPEPEIVAMLARAAEPPHIHREYVPNPDELTGLRGVVHRFGIYTALRNAKWLLLNGRRPPLESDFVPGPNDAWVDSMPTRESILADIIQTARRHEGAGNIQSAIELLRWTRSEFDYRDKALLGYLGTLEFRNAEYIRASDTLESAGAASSQNPELVLIFFCTQICAGTRERASACLKTAFLIPGINAQIGILRAFDLELSGLLQDAESQYSKALASAPAASSILETLTVHLFRSHGQHDICLRAWSRLFALSEANGPSDGPELLDTPWPSAIGHFAVLDGYLKACALGILPEKERLLIARPGIYPASGEPHVANWAALACFGDLIRTVSDPNEIAQLDSTRRFKQPLNVVRRSDGQLDFWPRVVTKAQRIWEEQNRPPLVATSAEQDARGQRALAEIGIPPDAWFVTLHVRGSVKEWVDRSTHSRNASIEDYVPALEEIVRRGGFIVRLGDASMPPLPDIKGVFDYARSEHKSDWLDVHLASKARFHLGTNSGMSVVPGMFGTPCAYTNWSPWGSYSWYGDALYAPKLLASRDGRLLHFEELLSDPFTTCESEYFFQTHGYQLINNSPEDIQSLVNDMFDLRAGKLQLSATELERQRALDDLLESTTGYGRCRLSPFFLRRHLGLLPVRAH